eukprot:COSAG02_NODE_10136_length_2013_cov_1.990073_5_plen_58_part_00
MIASKASLSQWVILTHTCVRAGADVIRRFDDGEALKVTVLSIMGKDMVVAAETDHDA